MYNTKCVLVHIEGSHKKYGILKNDFIKQWLHCCNYIGYIPLCQLRGFVRLSNRSLRDLVSMHMSASK